MVIGHALWNRRIRMRDGVELAADVFLPQTQGRVPAVVLRSPYTRGRTLDNPRSWIRLVDHGYAFVAVDVRGRNDSDGVWAPWIMDSQDGHDVIEWVAAQPWCTGDVGMVGGSYEGLTQWWTALSRPKHLRCIAPWCIGGVRCRLPFVGTGIPVQYRLWWATLVLGKSQQFPGSPPWEAMIERTPLGSLDERLGLQRSAWQKYVRGEVDFGSGEGALALDDFARIDIPVFIAAGWWDDQQTLCAWQAVQRAKSARHCRLLIGAWDHAGNMAPRPVLGGVDMSASVTDTIGLAEQFLAVHLKGERNSLASAPRCRVFMTGANRWDELDVWPPPQAVEQSLFLASGGDARGLHGNGRLVSESDGIRGSDTFVYDPDHPSRGMSNLTFFAWSDPPLDCRYLQRRNDCLVYTSEPLESPLLVSGRYWLSLFMSSDRPDTDVFVNLSDVHPDGRAISLTATNLPTTACLRLRYRNGPEPALLEPGRVYEIKLNGSWVHHLFKTGHRLRITICSGQFPTMARNAGTGRHWAEDEVLHSQTNTIHHSSAFPSRVVLPVLAERAC